MTFFTKHQSMSQNSALMELTCPPSAAQFLPDALRLARDTKTPPTVAQLSIAAATYSLRVAVKIK